MPTKASPLLRRTGQLSKNREGWDLIENDGWEKVETVAGVQVAVTVAGDWIGRKSENGALVTELSGADKKQLLERIDAWEANH